MIGWRSLLDHALADLGVSISDPRRDQLLTYLELLERWNRRMNLTSLEPGARVRQLVAEPLWAVRRLIPAGSYLDVGSGNGSPALPWCIVGDFSSCVFVEPRSRRAVFLRVALRRLGLMRAGVIQSRADMLGPDCARPDWVTVQGLRLDPPLLGSLRAMNPGVQVVWFSRRRTPPEPPVARIAVPGSDRELLVFGQRTSSGR